MTTWRLGGTAVVALALALALGVGPAAADSPVGGGATHLVVRIDRGAAATADRVSSVSTDDRALIERVVDGIDALPAPLDASGGCPPDLGARVVLLFYRDGDARPEATVVADPQGCGDVAIITRVDGVRTVERRSGGASLVAAVLADLGLAPLGG